MENKVYVLESSTISYTLGFEGEILYCELIRRLNECPLNQITKVLLKKTSLGAGDDISFRIVYLKDGKEKKFPWIQASLLNDNTKLFIEDLKSRIGSQVIWEDKREAGQMKDGKVIYDLQYLPFGYGGAGLSRGVQIWIYTIALGLAIFPLFYYIPLIIKGGYRIYANDTGFEIQKFRGTVFNWDAVSNVGIVNVKVRDTANHSTTRIMQLDISSKEKNNSIIMRYDHAIPFLKELASKNVISEEKVKGFL